MAGNLGKEDSSSVQDVQDPSITGSGHKRRRGSVQPSSSRDGKKSKQDIDRDHRAKKKGQMIELKKENKILQESNWRLLGKTDQMTMELKERGEEVISLRIMLDRQNNSIRELEEKLIALVEQHQQEIQALKEKHAQERVLCWCGKWYESLGIVEMVSNLGSVCLQESEFLLESEFRESIFRYLVVL